MTYFCVNAGAQGLDVKPDRIEWKDYALNLEDGSLTLPVDVYLCHVRNNGGKAEYSFLNAGCTYGACTILADRGINLTVEKSGGNYHFKSAIRNNGRDNYMGKYDSGDEVALDRSSISIYGIDWVVKRKKSGTELFGENAYDINRLNGRHLCRHYESDKMERAVLDGWSAPTDQAWLFIRQEDVNMVINGQQGQGQQLIDVSGLLRNTRFVRNAYNGFWQFYNYENYIAVGPDKENILQYSTLDGAKDASGSKLEAYVSMHPLLGNGLIETGYARNYGRFGAAGMQKPVCMAQKVAGLRPGTYLVTAQAFFANDGDCPDATASNAFLYASTTGTHNSVRIPMIDYEEQSLFDKYVNKHKKALTDGRFVDNTGYFRYNVAAAEYIAMAGSEDYVDNTSKNDDLLDENSFLIQVAVMVRPDEGGDGTGHLTVSVVKTAEAGRVYVRNVKVYYAGPYEFGLDAYNRDYTHIDDSRYKYPERFNLRRDFGFTNDITDEGDTHWEPIVLPVNVRARELKSAFGGFSDLGEETAGVRLSRLVGLSDDGKQIKFESVDLSDGDAAAIDAGECYVIKVSRAPSVARGAEYVFKTSFTPSTNSGSENITYIGPVYYFMALTRDCDFKTLIEGEEKMPTGRTYNNGVVTKTYETKGGNLTFTGYFFRPASAPEGSYVMSGGDMYHLTSEWTKLMGTCWHLDLDSANASQGNVLSFSFDGEGSTTSVAGVPGENGGGHAGARGIYSLSGQKICSDVDAAVLPKGVYIKDGRKYVVR